MPSRRIRLIANAIPLLNVRTGIGRYQRCLYGELERLYGTEVEIGYFDGLRVLPRPPRGPADLNRWSRSVDLFWKLPTPAALAIRILYHLRREASFQRASAGYDIYHEAGFTPFAPPAGLRTLFTIHDLSLLRYPQFHPRERTLFFRLFFTRRQRDVDAYLAVSRFTTLEMRRLLDLGDRPVTVTPLAHDPALFHERPREEVEEARRRHGLPERYFIFVGTGDPRKNLAIVPRALARAGLGEPLAIAGWAGWDRTVGGGAGASALCLGYVSDDDLARLYSGALALVYPSLYEGFGLPILEAMACGCPVVCTRRASLPEVAGDAALYLEEPADEAELAGLLRRVASESALRRRMSERGKERAAGFSWEETARRSYGAIRELVPPAEPLTR